MESFKYDPISAALGEIRVLSIHPGAETDDLELTISTVCIQNDPKPEYDAISYRWGAQDGNQLVKLNGHGFTLTSSQDQMIRNLRDVQNIRTVWIDAISINQEDTLERSDQVQLMRRIYQYARCACVYLDSHVDEHGPAYQKFLTFTSKCLVEDVLADEPSLWREICSALGSEYFNRVWVQQEMSNATRLEFQCRRVPMPFDCLSNFLTTWSAVDFVCILTGSAKLDGDHPFRKRPPRALESIVRTGSSISKEESQNLIELLYMSRVMGLECTDERDRIYGLMFLATNWKENYFVADYSLSTPEVFKRAMITYLQNCGSLSFLEYANLSHEDPGNTEGENPTWVPDWRKHPVPRFGWGNPEINREVECPYVASIHENTLCTTGIKIAEIGTVYGNFLGTRRGVLDAPACEFWVTFKDIVQKAASPVDLVDRNHRLFGLLVGGEPPEVGNEDFGLNFELFASLLDRLLGESDDPEISSLTLYDLRCASDTSREESNEKQSSNKDLVDEDSSDEDSSDDEDPAASLFSIFVRMTFQQRGQLIPFICLNGSIGHVSSCGKLGDELWFIPTCRCPIVLRPHNGKYIVVGHAWFDNKKLCESFGGRKEFLTVGERIGNFTVEEICLE